MQSITLILISILNSQSLHSFVLYIKNVVLFPTSMCVEKTNLLKFSLLVTHFSTDTELFIYDICV